MSRNVGRPKQPHLGLLRSPIALPCVANDTASDNIVPVGLTAPGLGEHVLHAEHPGRELFSAVLADVPVPHVKVLPVEPHNSVWDLVEVLEPDDPGSPDITFDRAHEVVTILHLNGAPGLIVIGLKVLVQDIGDLFGDVLEGIAHSAEADWKV